MAINLIDDIGGEHDTRKCVLAYKGISFELCYDTLFGVYIVAETLENQQVVMDIAYKLEKWL